MAFIAPSPVIPALRLLPLSLYHSRPSPLVLSLYDLPYQCLAQQLLSVITLALKGRLGNRLAQFDGIHNSILLHHVSLLAVALLFDSYRKFSSGLD